MKFKVRFEIDDGYAGGSRPHYFNIGSGEIDPDMKVEELSDMFEERLQEEFEQHVSFICGDKEAFLEWARQVQESKNKEE